MTFNRKLLILLLLSASGVVSAPRASAASSPTHARHAMVVSVNGFASAAGIEVLKRGGNAVDAAVAVGFALAVVHPQAGNIGGGGFMLLRLATGDTHFIDFRETAPAAATEKMYQDAQGNLLPDASTIGYKAIAVPSSVAGLTYAQKKFGKLTLGTVMAPAIRMARYGFPLSFFDARDFRDDALAKFPESKRIFQVNRLHGGSYYEEGDTFRQPELARTLDRIARNPRDFYHGLLAKELAAAVQKGGGLLTAEDLAKYEVKERPAVRGSYREYQIIGAPPPSSGGVVMLEALNILEPIPLARMGTLTAESIHGSTEP